MPAWEIGGLALLMFGDFVADDPGTGVLTRGAFLHGSGPLIMFSAV